MTASRDSPGNEARRKLLIKKGVIENRAREFGERTFCRRRCLRLCGEWSTQRAYEASTVAINTNGTARRVWIIAEDDMPSMPRAFNVRVKGILEARVCNTIRWWMARTKEHNPWSWEVVRTCYFCRDNDTTRWTRTVRLPVEFAKSGRHQESEVVPQRVTLEWISFVDILQIYQWVPAIWVRMYKSASFKVHGKRPVMHPRAREMLFKNWESTLIIGRWRSAFFDFTCTVLWLRSLFLSSYVSWLYPGFNVGCPAAYKYYAILCNTAL